MNIADSINTLRNRLPEMPSMSRILLLSTLAVGAIAAETRQEVQAATREEAKPLLLEKMDSPGAGGMDLPDGIGLEWSEISSESAWRIQEAGRQLEARFGQDLGKFVVLDGVDPHAQVLAVVEGGGPTKQFGVVWAFKASAAKKGFGNQLDSNKTSTGTFKLGPVDGRGGDIGIIRDREGYGQRVGRPNQGTPTIVTRFISMQGLDPENKNTAAREIGIHPTNYPARLGDADSGGCVRVDDGAGLILSAIVTNRAEEGGITYMVVIDPADTSFTVPASERGRRVSMKSEPGEEDPWGEGESE